MNKKKVLVIDDEPHVLRFVNASLSAAGYQVLTAESGEEGLNIFNTENPDMVILDVLMLPMSGFEVLDRIRNFSTVPVIVFTAHDFVAKQAINNGANDFIGKPFLPDDLKSKIIKLIGNS
jgi:two-component system, OmpR family, KDP operon response regulator KdpE